MGLRDRFFRFLSKIFRVDSDPRVVDDISLVTLIPNHSQPNSPRPVSYATSHTHTPAAGEPPGFAHVPWDPLEVSYTMPAPPEVAGPRLSEPGYAGSAPPKSAGAGYTPPSFHSGPETRYQMDDFFEVHTSLNTPTPNTPTSTAPPAYHDERDENSSLSSSGFYIAPSTQLVPRRGHVITVSSPDRYRNDNYAVVDPVVPPYAPPYANCHGPHYHSDRSRTYSHFPHLHHVISTQQHPGHANICYRRN